MTRLPGIFPIKVLGHGTSISQTSVALASLFPVTRLITVAFLQVELRNLSGTCFLNEGQFCELEAGAQTDQI